MQRREHARYRLWFPVQIEAGGQVKIAINHNIGAGGMLIVLCAEMKIGESVSVTFTTRSTSDGSDRAPRSPC